MKHSQLMKSAIVLGLITFRVSSANAEMVIRFSAAPPADHVIVSHIPDEKAGWGCRNSSTVGRRDLGQSFLAPFDFTMTAFSFQINAGIRADAASAPVTVTLFESSRSGVIGDVISTQKGAYLGRTSRAAPEGWVVFDIEDIPLRAGKYYAVVLSWDESKPTMEQGFYLETSGTYKDGQAWTSVNGARYTGVAGKPDPRDVVFVVQGKVVPE